MTTTLLKTLAEEIVEVFFLSFFVVNKSYQYYKTNIHNTSRNSKEHNWKNYEKSIYLSDFHTMLLRATLVAIMKKNHFATCPLNLHATISPGLRSFLIVISSMSIYKITGVSVLLPKLIMRLGKFTLKSFYLCMIKIGLWNIM